MIELIKENDLNRALGKRTTPISRFKRNDDK